MDPNGGHQTIYMTLNTSNAMPRAILKQNMSPSSTLSVVSDDLAISTILRIVDQPV